MGVREAIQSKRGVVVAAVFFLIAVIVTYSQMTGRTSNSTLDGTGGYFSIDDGTTWFEADASKIPPFEYKGQQAVRAYVFTCDGGKTRFVGFLERYRPDAKQLLEKGNSGAPSLAANNSVLISNGVEVKPPKANGEWVSRKAPAGIAITSQIKCPPGQSGTPELVLP